MNDAQPEPLTDSEAEAVLVALGEHLQWKDVQNVPPIDSRLYLSQKVTQGGSYGMQWYAIWKGTQAKPFVAGMESEIGPTIKAVECTTLAAAQAACERHYATGQWK